MSKRFADPSSELYVLAANWSDIASEGAAHYNGD
jgi:hypothetical protein